MIVLGQNDNVMAAAIKQKFKMLLHAAATLT